MLSIHNPSLSLSIDPELGRFSIQPAQIAQIAEKRFPALEGVHLGCEYILNRRHYHTLGTGWQADALSERVLTTVEHGDIDVITLNVPQDANGIGLALTFGITREHPLVLWKGRMINQGTSAVKIRRIDLIQVGDQPASKLTFPAAQLLSEKGFFSNGWQSWSPANWYRADAKMNISRSGPLQHPMIYNPGTPLPRQRGIFSSDMFAVLSDQGSRTGLVVGFLAQKNHFGSIQMDFNLGRLRMWANGDDALLQSGEAMETDWAVVSPVVLDHRAPLETYYEAVARENHVKPPGEAPLGWCSWYHYYSSVTARDIEDNLSAIVKSHEEFPIQLVQIDDGFESQVGDWFSFKPTFPDGLAPLAKGIEQEGLVPGIWLAPFIVNPRSKLMHEHLDWILFNRFGRPVNAGYNWNVMTTGLDLTVPEALAYICEVVKKASTEWGFNYLKLDFYYAAGLRGNYHDPTKTRAQVLRMGMEAIREVVGPQVTLLGCGAPLGSMIGIVDLMRIGPDVSGDWFPNFRGLKQLVRQEPSIPCARNSIRNILTRAGMNRLWWINDPDCLLVRPDSNLSLAEVRSLATVIGMTGGALLISDDMAHLPVDRLHIAEVLYPILWESARVIDLYDTEFPTKMRLDQVNESGEWYLLAALNLVDQPVDIRITPQEYFLEAGEYICREFWSGKISAMSAVQPLVFTQVPAHGAVLVAVRRRSGHPVQYLGSEMHFSQGIEIAEWVEKANQTEITLRLPRKASGKVFIWVENDACQFLVNGVPNLAEKVQANVLSLQVDVDGFCRILIQH